MKSKLDWSKFGQLGAMTQLASTNAYSPFTYSGHGTLYTTAALRGASPLDYAIQVAKGLN